MPRSIIRIALLAAALALTACQLASPGAGSGATPQEPTANAITGGEIEVSALDDGPKATPAEPGAPVPTPADAAPDSVAPDSVAAAGALPDDAPAVAKPVKSEAQVACERKGGNWTGLGNEIGRTCVMITRDAGKSCTRKSQCDSECLARSQTCAPFRPLLGCNEVLQNNGSRVTLCIE